MTSFVGNSSLLANAYGPQLPSSLGGNTATYEAKMQGPITKGGSRRRRRRGGRRSKKSHSVLRSHRRTRRSYV
jgi:hypothetical protein